MRHFLTLATALVLVTSNTSAQEHWRTSWHASPQATWGGQFALPTNIPASLHDQTVQETLRLSAGGKRLRLVLSNRYGTGPLLINAASVAKIGGASVALRFSGAPSASVPPGADLVSDIVDLPLQALALITVSTYFAQATPLTTFHWGAQQTALVAAGDRTGAAIKTGSQFGGRAFLKAVLVDDTTPAASVAVFGDSISDGNGSTPDTNRRWPDFLAVRLAADPAKHGVGVANASISGARLLQDQMGQNALARFEQDVLAQPGIKSVVVMMGINDIGWPGSAFAPQDPAVTPEQLIFAWRQLIAAAKIRQVRILGATLPPFEGALHGTPFAGHFSVAKDAVRRAVNDWLRSAHEFDAIIDFDAVLRDPIHPARMLPSYDSGDHLHPGDAGYQAMADAVDLPALFGATQLNLPAW